MDFSKNCNVLDIFLYTVEICFSWISKTPRNHNNAGISNFVWNYLISVYTVCSWYLIIKKKLTALNIWSWNVLRRKIRTPRHFASYRIILRLSGHCLVTSWHEIQISRKISYYCFKFRYLLAYNVWGIKDIKRFSREISIFS